MRLVAQHVATCNNRREGRRTWLTKEHTWLVRLAYATPRCVYGESLGGSATRTNLEVANYNSEYRITLFGVALKTMEFAEKNGIERIEYG